jgi:hypothetical protein
LGVEARSSYNLVASMQSVSRMSRISIQCYHSLDLTNHPSPPFWSVLIKSTQRSRLAF